jgi:hypothetical protein
VRDPPRKTPTVKMSIARFSSPTATWTGGLLAENVPYERKQSDSSTTV